jgi:hypothetical protein
MIIEIPFNEARYALKFRRIRPKLNTLLVRSRSMAAVKSHMPPARPYQYFSRYLR